MSIEVVPGEAPRSGHLTSILRLEASRSAASLAHAAALVETETADVPDLVIDLTGGAAAGAASILTVALNGQSGLATGLAAVLADGLRPELVARLDGKIVAVARPMLLDGVWLGRIANDILAAAVTLLEACAARLAKGVLAPTDEEPEFVSRPPEGLLACYVPHIVAGLAGRAVARLTTRRAFYWRTAYRLVDGPGIAGTGRVDGAPFAVLPDDGQRFYADPFFPELGP